MTKSKATRIRLSILLIILAIVVYNFFTMKNPIIYQEDFTKLQMGNPGKKKVPNELTKHSIQSAENFYANSEFAEFFEDVPCKDTYLLYNYFSELKNNRGLRTMTLKCFAVELTKIGFFDRAIEIANMIKDQSTWENIVKELLNDGNVDRAIEVADSMSSTLPFKDNYPDKNEFIQAKEDIVKYLAEKGDFARALEVAKSINDTLLNKITNLINIDNNKYNQFKNYLSALSVGSFSIVSKELLKAGKPEEAFKIASSIDDINSEGKIDLLRNIALKYWEDDQYKEAMEVMQYAINSLESLNPNEQSFNSEGYKWYGFNLGYAKLDGMQKISQDLAIAGEQEYSKNIYEKILNVADSVYSKHQDPYIYGNIAESLAKSGDMEWSKHVYEKVWNLHLTNKKDKDKGTKDWNLRYLIGSIIDSGHYAWGLDLVDKYVDESEKSYFYECSATTLLKDNEVDMANQLIQKAVDFAANDRSDEQDYWWRHPTKSDICWEYAKELAKLNKSDLACEYFKKAIKTYKETHKDEDFTGWGKKTMCADLLAAGKFDWALEMVNTINDDYSRDYSFVDIAKYLIEHGQIEDSIEYIDKMRDQKEKFYQLKDISESLIEKKKYNNFEKIIGIMLDCAGGYTDETERNEYFFVICQILLDLPCEEQQKYIQKFMTAYES
ncbi:hypothetical protein KKB18_03020 [bacterium]|nr:hypothetical protein [bacterium]